MCCSGESKDTQNSIGDRITDRAGRAAPRVQQETASQLVPAVQHPEFNRRPHHGSCRPCSAKSSAGDRITARAGRATPGLQQETASQLVPARSKAGQCYAGNAAKPVRLERAVSKHSLYTLGCMSQTQQV